MRANFDRCLSMACVVMLATFLPLSNSIAADKDAEKYAQQLVDAGNRTITELIKRFRPHVAEEHRELLSPDRIRVVFLANFNAFADYGKQEIIIPAQFLSEIFGQVQGLLMVNKNPSLLAPYERWVEYLTKHSHEVAKRASKGTLTVEHVKLQTFWEFAGLPAPPNLSAKDAKIQEEMMMNALALIVGHELGHLVLNHKPYQEIKENRAAISQRQEYAADAFAEHLLRKSNMRISAGLTTFFWRFATNESLYKRAPDGSHPSANCRIYRIGNREVREMARDPVGSAGMKSWSGKNISQILEEWDELAQGCPP